MQQQPTPQQALDTLDQAISTINANRQTHLALQNCLAILQERIKVIEDLETGLRLWQSRAEVLDAALRDIAPLHPLVDQSGAELPTSQN